MRIRFVDAFTDRPFAGNPAAVVLLDDAPFPQDDRLRRLAAELNLSETAYARRLTGREDADWALRWFTPSTEVRLCGHATLATAHVLHSLGQVTDVVRFTTLSGVLTARVRGAEITLDFPTASLTPQPVSSAVSAALGAEVVASHATGSQLGDLLVELADEQTVRALAPDMSALARLPTRGVIVTAAAERPHCGYDYVSRFFAPAIGIAEDPVTGAAHTALAPLWSPRLGSERLTGLQVSARTGQVQTTLRGERTLLTGGAVNVMTGELHPRL